MESLEHQLSLAKVRETALSSENSTLKEKLEAAPQSEISALRLHNKALQDALNKANAKHTRLADDMTLHINKTQGFYNVYSPTVKPLQSKSMIR